MTIADAKCLSSWSTNKRILCMNWSQRFDITLNAHHVANTLSQFVVNNNCTECVFLDNNCGHCARPRMPDKTQTSHESSHDYFVRMNEIRVIILRYFVFNEICLKLTVRYVIHVAKDVRYAGWCEHWIHVRCDLVNIGRLLMWRVNRHNRMNRLRIQYTTIWVDSSSRLIIC